MSRSEVSRPLEGGCLEGTPSWVSRRRTGCGSGVHEDADILFIDERKPSVQGEIFECWSHVGQSSKCGAII